MKSKKLLFLPISAMWLLSMIGLLVNETSGKQPSISSLPMNIQSIRESDSFFYVQAEYPQFETAGTDFKTNPGARRPSIRLLEVVFKGKS